MVTFTHLSRKEKNAERENEGLKSYHEDSPAVASCTPDATASSESPGHTR